MQIPHLGLNSPEVLQPPAGAPSVLSLKGVTPACITPPDQTLECNADPNTENVNKSEQEYLDSLCDVIERHREKTLLNKIPTVKRKPKPKAKVEKKETKTIEKEDTDDEYTKIKVLEDLPTFTGMDAKNYTLKNNDIVSIPIYNARMLSDAGKVKLVKEVKA